MTSATVNYPINKLPEIIKSSACHLIANKSLKWIDLFSYMEIYNCFPLHILFKVTLFKSYGWRVTTCIIVLQTARLTAKFFVLLRWSSLDYRINLLCFPKFCWGRYSHEDEFSPFCHEDGFSPFCHLSMAFETEIFPYQERKTSSPFQPHHLRLDYLYLKDSMYFI